MRFHCFSSPSSSCRFPPTAYCPIPCLVLGTIYHSHPPFHTMSTHMNMNTTTRSSQSSQAKGRPTPLLSSSLFTPPKTQAIKRHADIFSPRPETPSPPQFSFLDSPTPTGKQRNNAPSPPTPPRPRRRQALSDTTNAVHPRKVCGKSSFELILAAFPAPPKRLPPPFFRSLPASHTIRSHEMKQSPLRKEEVESDSGSESDCRTITGIPATPSTANSGWDNFWSEVSWPGLYRATLTAATLPGRGLVES